MKSIVILLAVAAAGAVAWTQFPGLRTKITSAANEYGGWTEEARREDPVGFIRHAKQQLQSDIEKFEETQATLGTTKKNAEDNLEKFRNREVVATQLANTGKELFRSAEEGGSWPLEWEGRTYTREQFIEQIDMLLADKRNAAARQADYRQVLDKVASTRTELRSRISDSRMALDELDAKESMVQVEKLTAETDALLAQVNELVEGNNRLADDPVRNIEDILAEQTDRAEAEAEQAPSAALDFLNS